MWCDLQPTAYQRTLGHSEEESRPCEKLLSIDMHQAPAGKEEGVMEDSGEDRLDKS